MRCKPKKYFMIQLSNWKVVIELKPQQIWVYTLTTQGEYAVERDCVCIVFDEEEFNRYFNKLN